MADKKILTLGERAANWAKVLAVIATVAGAAVTGGLAWLKGDDAQQNIDHLIQQLGKRVAKQERVINTQSEKLEKMARRMIFFQGHQAGVSAGKLSFKLASAEKKLDQCMSKPGKIKKSELMEILGAARSISRPRIKASGGATKPQGIPRLEPKPFRKKNGKK